MDALIQIDLQGHINHAYTYIYVYMHISNGKMIEFTGAR